jgi:AmmeMemoRadiSam system protein A
MASRAPFPDLPPPIDLTAGEQAQLWAIASRALRDRVLGGPDGPGGSRARGIAEPALTGTLGRRAGVFVTLRRDGDLRGCVGTAEGLEPLHVAVERLAVAAATTDHRFPPLRPEELPGTELEITVLGMLVKLPAEPGALLDGLEPEEHGVRIRVGDRGGLLLPQVARRFGWSAVELLGQLSLKAGLWRDAWRDPRAEIFGFTATSFECRDPAGGG